MIDRAIKQCLGQMIKGVQVVGAAHDGLQRAYTSHWLTQVSFDEPIVMASVSPKHDTHPLLVAAGEFAVSILAGDQIAEGQYFSYPGRKFRYVAPEYLTEWPERPGGPPVVVDAIAWMRCETFERMPMRDHELFFARVVEVVPIRLREPPLLYSSRLGWRITGDRAREPGTSVRDQLLARVDGADERTADGADDGAGGDAR
jgi:flavin reductase (DIM6/NTAB) family NADH-FMN oxidoreductase RutF